MAEGSGITQLLISTHPGQLGPVGLSLGEGSLLPGEPHKLLALCPGCDCPQAVHLCHLPVPPPAPISLSPWHTQSSPAVPQLTLQKGNNFQISYGLLQLRSPWAALTSVSVLQTLQVLMSSEGDHGSWPGCPRTPLVSVAQQRAH